MCGGADGEGPGDMIFCRELECGELISLEEAERSPVGDRQS